MGFMARDVMGIWVIGMRTDGTDDAMPKGTIRTRSRERMGVRISRGAGGREETGGVERGAV
jgi:hypothetical protein